MENPEDSFRQGHRNIVLAFGQGLANVIEDLTETIPDHDRIQIYLSSNLLQSAHTCANVTVGDWRDPLSRAQRILDQISKMLSSNENFEVDDSLQLDVTHITMPEPVSGKRMWRFGTDSYPNFLKNKRSIIQIKNKDHLCCARALVVAKACMHNHPDFENIKRGCPIQKIRTQALQEEACVPTDQPTPLQAIPLLQIVLSDYQIVIVSAEDGHGIVHKGPETDKQLILLSHNSHFDVVTSLPAFFNKVYYCLKCEKGFHHDNITEHWCVGVKCWCCHQTDCPDFELFKKEGPATIYCTHCDGKFFGITCQVNHMTKTSSGQDANHNQRNSVCCSHCVCSICHFSYNLQKIKEHRCGERECPCCHKVCNLKQHKCFIQPIKKKKKKKERGEQDEEDEEDAEEQDENEYVDEEDESTVFVYFDIEARQDDKNHVANLLCAETDRNNQQYTFWGESCVSNFLHCCYHLSHQAGAQQLIVVAHNFKGYDGYIIITQLKHIVNGAKILTLSIPQIRFINSLNFLPVALAEFPDTFGLTEIKKGFFSHFFNKKENEMYVGCMPEKEYYDPDGMSPKRKKEFET